MNFTKYLNKPLSWWLSSPFYVYKRLFYSNRDYFTIHEDGVASVHYHDFLKDPKFKEAYAASRETGMRFRMYTAVWAAKQALHIEGDFVECGVHRGGYSLAIMHIIDWERCNRTFWLADTWAGFADEQKHLLESAAKTITKYGNIFEEVKATFSKYPNVEFVRGMVPDTLPQIKAEKIAYLSLDMNVAEPEIAALEYLWPRISSGGIVVLDDYCYNGYPKHYKLFEEWSKRSGVPILGTPSGQGIIIKP